MIYNFDNLSFQLLSVGKYTHKPNYYNVDKRPFSALSYRLSGEATFNINGEIYKIKPGDIIFVPANVSYKVDYSPSESIVVHLLDCNYSIVEKIDNNENINAKSLFLHMLTSFNEERNVNKTKSQLYNLLALLSENNATLYNDVEFDSLVKKLKENYLSPEFNVQQLLSYSNYSYSTLQRKFKRFIGEGVNEYIIKLKMLKALELLRIGSLSIKEIAFACGFNDEKYFSRQFKKTFGYPPKEFNNKFGV